MAMPEVRDDRELRDGWEVAASARGACAGPGDIDGLSWSPARVPGTAAAAVGSDGRDFDAEDWWFRTRFGAPDDAQRGSRILLELDGIATVAEVYLNGERVLESESMWESHRLDVSDRLQRENELAIVCRALRPLLGASRRPRQRWRSGIAAEGNLRWYRTMIFGRSPGYAPGPAPVGPWRPVRLVALPEAGAEWLRLTPRVSGRDGVLEVCAKLTGEAHDAVVLLGEQRTQLGADGGGLATAELRISDVERWWPHTHGEPRLYDFALELNGRRCEERRIGFRTLRFADEILIDGLDLHVNDVPIFARGAVWTPPDLVSMAPQPGQLRVLLERVRDAGMNMLRVIGTGAYESGTFHDLCDEIGILVWQDMMFASLDYPLSDDGFRARVEAEARAVVGRLAWRPSLTVLCGSHELEQQPAMLGLDPKLARDSFWEDTLPEVLAESGAECAYVRSTPCGGALPFEPRTGIAHYYGVGGYFAPLDDARRAELRFAAECLPFAHVPDEVDSPVGDPRWKTGVLRDPGSGLGMAPAWDFDDVRDFYLEQLFEIDPTELRRTDQERYLELSRAASGEVLAEVMGEWRRERSPCRGALMIWLKDMAPGPGFGVLDSEGTPKVVYHHLRRALAPVTIWTTDERTNGVDIHAANDRGEALRCRLRVALYQDLRARVAESCEDIEIPPHGSVWRSAEGLLGRFVDAAYAYSFGPPAQDAIVVSLEQPEEPYELIAQAFRFPVGRPLQLLDGDELGIEASLGRSRSSELHLAISSKRLAYGVRVHVPGYIAAEDSFSVEPGVARLVRLCAAEPDAIPRGGSLTALNLRDRVSIKAPSE